MRALMFAILSGSISFVFRGIAHAQTPPSTVDGYITAAQSRRRESHLKKFPTVGHRHLLRNDLESEQYIARHAEGAVT